MGSLAVGGLLALIRKIFTAASPAGLAFDTGSYAAVDAYIDQQMRRLKIPGAALAVVEGDKIVYRRGYGRAGPGGEVRIGGAEAGVLRCSAPPGLVTAQRPARPRS